MYYQCFFLKNFISFIHHTKSIVTFSIIFLNWTDRQGVLTKSLRKKRYFSKDRILGSSKGVPVEKYIFVFSHVFIIFLNFGLFNHVTFLCVISLKRVGFPSSDLETL